MVAISYTVRDGSGQITRGSIEGKGNSLLAIGSGESVSLALDRMEIADYMREGQDVVIIMLDGRKITLENFYGSDGAANRLYLSEDNTLYEVLLTQGDDDILYALYDDAGGWGKWSANDALLHVDRPEVVAEAASNDNDLVAAAPVLPLLGALGGAGVAGLAVSGAAAVGVAAVAGGGGSENPDPVDATPIAVDTTPVLIAGDGVVDPGFAVSGTAPAGSTVTIDVGGQRQVVTSGADGTWTATFTGTTFPADGLHTAVVSVVTATETQSLTGPVVTIDLTPPDLQVTSGTQSVGEFFNASTHASGVTLSGQGEPGAELTVEIDGISHTTTVTSSGTWTVNFTSTELPGGEYTSNVTLTAVDTYGNSAIYTDTVLIDTVPWQVSVNTVEGDDIANASEVAQGVTISGSSEPGITITVEMQGVTRTVTVDSTGTWTVDFDSTEVPSGEYDAVVTATTIDAYGNSSSTSHTVRVDTVGTVAIDAASIAGDNIVNSSEASAGLQLTGSTQPGSTVDVVFQGQTYTATVAADGSWTASVPSGGIATGTYSTTFTATSTDVAGNTATDTRTINVDTDAAVSIAQTGVIQNGVLNATELSQAFTLTGTTEPGSTVQVTLGNVTQAATVDAAGNWTASFAANSIPTGEYTTNITAVATDSVGNMQTVTQTVDVDTDAGFVTISSVPVETDDVINHTEASDGVVLTGTATPGMTVTVTMGGASRDVVSSGSGSWTAFFPNSDIVPGTYDAAITATIQDAAGNTRSASDSVRVDTVVENLNLSANAIEVDNVINGQERSDGVVLTGTTEPGSTLVVQLGSVSRIAVVDAAGTWTATFAPSDIPTGEYSANVIATATDVAGNTESVSNTVRVDTLVNTLTQAPVEGNNIVGAAEAANGATLTGQVEPGSSVTVTLGNVQRVAVVDANGNWTASFTAGEIPPGDYTTSATVVATDSAGNTRTESQSVEIDTISPDAPLIMSFTKSLSGVRSIGTELTSDTLDIRQIDGSGSVNAVAHTQSQNVGFGELTFDFQNPIPDGSHLVVTREDAAGNASGTLFVLEDTATSVVDLANPGFNQFNIQSIDMQFATDTELEITESQLLSLSDASNDLLINGGIDDQVTAIGATRTGQTQTIGGQSYDVYTFNNSGANLIIEDEIKVII